ncbi:MAG TPA: ABC transporter ATP-binding protein [Micromonosporaceae bacterium]|jgi:branched-chain amino acid transport system ATP-binding protein
MAGVPPLLSVVDLRVRIGGSPILHGVTFDVPGTGVTVLLGRNGAGKSTTLKAVLGLTPIGSQVGGRVLFDGVPTANVATHQLVRRGLGYVPEDRGIFAGLTVAENLKLAHRVDKPDYDTAYGLFPELKQRGRQRAGTLSGGQQQMLAIARVLINPNRLLLVDEPTKGLAPRLVTEVADVVSRVAHSVPILLVEQNLGLVRRVGHDAVVLSAGTVAYSGALGPLLDDEQLTRSLLGVGQHHDAARGGLVA